MFEPESARVMFNAVETRAAEAATGNDIPNQLGPSFIGLILSTMCVQTFH